ncbi:PAS domain-containing protein [Gillisia sp. Q332]|uniref:PAS domain-containing protein n=1 Tax=Gillisia xinjiangensis TaxID=3384765 RepID=UPI003918728F
MSKFKDNLSNMACLDLYLSSLSNEEYRTIKHKIHPNEQVSPLLSMDIFSSSHFQSLEKGRKKMDLASLLIHDTAKEWKFDHELILNKDYDALVLTDANQTIKWVNKGFSKMTGYPANYALGKQPKFLQGAGTKPETRISIREKLELSDVFSEIVVNYRKNKEKYICEITIIPLLNSRSSLTHFLAIEKEVA